MNPRTATSAALIAAALLTATACGTDNNRGIAERAPKKPAANAEQANKGCGKDSDLSQSDWEELCGPGAVGNGQAPDTELKVGDTFKYPDGVRATISSISQLTQFGEFDDRPKANQIAFRVSLDVKNDSKKPVQLDDFAIDASGATNGGNVELFMVEAGAKQLMGRVAPGATAKGTNEFAITKSSGRQIVATVSRMDEDTILDEDPNWTGPIR
ncbi:hypothetical protein [Streptomyces sp. NPDC006784]|uniref:hypothetical protein n=1 Tax=Streptomyces sp. NPDC006784 TaxID=3364764 RepID=UPI0036B08FDA